MWTQSVEMTYVDFLGSRKRSPERAGIPSTLTASPYTSQSSSGQGSEAETGSRDLRAELLAAEAEHFARIKGPGDEPSVTSSATPKRMLDAAPDDTGSSDEDPDVKRRRILEESRDIDADSGGYDSDSSDEDSDEDEEDETAELARELEKIKRERAEKKAQEDAEKAAQEQEAREQDIALGNPLLNPQSFNVKRRWDDDVIFKNQARGTEDKGKKKEFVNVCGM
ncbi:MAG: hypothetical protein Q9227_008162 [Pyrenula ochraceoflavens]